MLVPSKVVMRGEGIENLAGVCEVRLQSEDAQLRVWKVDEVEVEDLDIKSARIE